MWLQIGTGYVMASLLIELANPEPSSPEEREKLLDSILENVHAANGIASQHARIFREYIWFTKPDKPFVRTDKRTVKRRDTVLLYENEIEEFYRHVERDGNLNADVDLASVDSIAKEIRRLLGAADVSAADRISGDEDLLHAGVDSLAAASISNSFRSALRKRNIVIEGEGLAMSAKFVYSHPSINALAEALYAIVEQKGSSDDSVALQTKKIEEFLAKYGASQGSKHQNGHAVSNGTHGQTVILTGSTGSLGSYLLDSLLQKEDVKKVYCLNRADDGKTKQTAQSEPRGLSTKWSDKVEFLQVDLSKPNFGLGEDAYRNLLNQTTHIIRKFPTMVLFTIRSFQGIS
jgi:aryl carrier-like protein